MHPDLCIAPTAANITRGAAVHEKAIDQEHSQVLLRRTNSIAMAIAPNHCCAVACASVAQLTRPSERACSRQLSLLGSLALDEVLEVDHGRQQQEGHAAGR